MCYFLVVGIPKSSSQGWAVSLPRDIKLSGSHYAKLPEAFPRFEFKNIVHGQCSCDLFRDHKEVNTRALERRYRKKGWSQQRVAKLISEKLNSANPDEGIMKSVREWVAGVAEAEGTVMVLVHWDTDPFPKTDHPVQITAERLVEDAGAVLAEQVTIINRTANQAL